MRLMTLLIVFAQSAVSRLAVATPSGDFQPYSPTERISAPIYVLIAYSTIWLFVLLFVVSVWRRQRRVEAELAQVLQRLERQADADSSPNG